jgi:hypothetical protein
MAGKREPGEGRCPDGDQRTYVTAEVDLTGDRLFLGERGSERPNVIIGGRERKKRGCSQSRFIAKRL